MLHPIPFPWKIRSCNQASERSSRLRSRLVMLWILQQMRKQPEFELSSAIQPEISDTQMQKHSSISVSHTLKSTKWRKLQKIIENLEPFLPVLQCSPPLKEPPGSWQRAWPMWRCGCRQLQQSEEPQQEWQVPIATQQWNPLQIQTQMLPCSEWNYPTTPRKHRENQVYSELIIKYKTKKEMWRTDIGFGFTFSLMASWTITASVLTAKTTSEVRTSVSKNWMSWFKAASRYLILILVDCLSPVHIQHDISEKRIQATIQPKPRP